MTPQTIDAKPKPCPCSIRNSKNSIKARVSPTANSASVHAGPEPREAVLRSIFQPTHHQNRNIARMYSQNKVVSQWCPIETWRFSLNMSVTTTLGTGSRHRTRRYRPELWAGSPWKACGDKAKSISKLAAERTILHVHLVVITFVPHDLGSEIGFRPILAPEFPPAK